MTMLPHTNPGLVYDPWLPSALSGAAACVFQYQLLLLQSHALGTLYTQYMYASFGQ